MFDNKDIFLRPARPADCMALAQTLRPADRAELTASHPGQEPAALLLGFLQSSIHCFALLYQGRPAAIFGLAPDAWLGNRACVWLLTGQLIESIPKTFVRIARRFVAAALTQYAELYNFADGRYAAALRFVRRLGGTFDGTFCQTESARFLRFTIRRN